MNFSFLKKTEQVFIPRRFEQVVILHVLKNMLKDNVTRVPLLLGIHGPSGEGKTYQCEFILRNMGVKRYLISGGQLDSPKSGEPAQLIRNTYLKAGEGIRGGAGKLAAILVNDIDTGLGTFGGKNQFTMNQQTVFGELMHLVDYPNSVEGHETERVPIIVTGNDFTKLYAPLMRAGRMTAFEWIPSLDERVEVVANMFPELSKDEIRRLVVALNEKLGVDPSDTRNSLPVAFYSHLRSTLLDEDLWDHVELYGVYRAVDELLKGNEPDFSASVHYQRVLEKGIELAFSNQLFNNHLENHTKST